MDLFLVVADIALFPTSSLVRPPFLFPDHQSSIALKSNWCTAASAARRGRRAEGESEQRGGKAETGSARAIST